MSVQSAPPQQQQRATPEGNARQLVAEAFSGTPGRMRIYGAIAVALCLVFGVLGFLFVRHLDDTLGAERAHAAQLVRIQTIRTSVVKADAAATNAFLVGGLEPASVRQSYTDGIDTAAESIAAASSAEPSDSATLQAVNKDLATYTGLIESARANNRQGFPIGAAYLRQASGSIENNVLPPLADLANKERQRVNAASDSAYHTYNAIFWLLVVALILLIAIQVWLFRRTRRIINPPLAAGTAIVLVFGAIALAVLASTMDQSNKAKNGPYAQTVALATARINGFDAKSAESLTLIARGSGQAYEQRFQTVAADADSALAGLSSAQTGSGERTTSGDFRAYVTQHVQVRKDDDGGNWDAAVALATGSGKANQAFATFDSASGEALSARAKQLSDDLAHARGLLLALSWLLLVGGVVAAFLARRGIARRLREYR